MKSSTGSSASPEVDKDHQEDETPSCSYPLPPPNHKTPPFSRLVTLFERLSGERKADQRRKLLERWFNGWRRDVGKDLYPVLRLLLPQKDTERALYGLKETNLAKTYIKVIPLGPKDPDSIRLLKWKKPMTKDVAAGDFPSVLYEVVNKRSSVADGSLTVEDVNNILDELSQNSGRQEAQTKILMRVYNNTTSEEQRWIARIILKDMQISVKEGTILSVYHPDATDLFNACSDLKRVVNELWDTSRRLNAEEKQVTIMQKFSPMLCFKPGSRLETAIQGMSGQPFIIEEKLDGERMQIHMRKKNFFYSSRNGKDYTYLYGRTPDKGSLTPYIWNAFDARVQEIILDGEMLVWDPVSGRSLPFGTLKTAALDKSKDHLSPRPYFKIFDMLYLNGMCLTNRSVKFRKRNLRAYVKEVKGRMEFITEFEGSTIADVRKRLEDIMASRGEGLVIKHPSSRYILGGREKDWVKIKPEYMDNMGETVEVIVIGGNFGSGWRSGGVSTLICAARDDRKTNEDEDEIKYSSFVRIGTGLSYADYVWIRQRNWKTFDKKNIPSWYQASKKGTDDKGDIYLEPEDSFLLEVKAAEITPSDQYHIGFTMRFPRAKRIRDDKNISECMTVTEVLESMKLEKKRKMEDPEPKSTKKRKSTKKSVTVLPEYRGENLQDFTKKTGIFENLKFMVSSDPGKRNGDKEKRELLRLIHENGGSYVQVVKGDEPILVVYGGLSTPYDIKLIIDKGIHDIIRPSWIYDCVDERKRLPLHRKYFFYATNDRKADKDYVGADVSEGKDTGKITAGDSEISQVDEEKTGSLVTGSSFDDWLTVEKELGRSIDNEDASDSETDPDSEYDELRFDPELEEWVMSDSLGSSRIDQSGNHTSAEEVATKDVEGDDEKPNETMFSQVQSKMGETDSAMEYDTDMLFRHLCFYLDSPANAERHNMEVKPRYRDQITSSFVDIEGIIMANGGKIVDLDDPKLTHVVLDKRDTARRKELMKQTSRPKRPYLVLSDFVRACIEESSLLDEPGFAP